MIIRNTKDLEIGENIYQFYFNIDGDIAYLKYCITNIEDDYFFTCTTNYGEKVTFGIGLGTSLYLTTRLQKRSFHKIAKPLIIQMMETKNNWNYSFDKDIFEKVKNKYYNSYPELFIF